MSDSHRKTLYAVTVFMSSAMLMALEIDAGRLTAPYTGSSLYTWTSIIGVVLAGLSLGNWIGGKLAGRKDGHLMLGLALAGSAVTTLIIIPLLIASAGPIQHLHAGPIWTSFMLISALFFLPAMMLGIISPLATALYLELDKRTGKVLGKMHALAALGSILGTFLTGYVLIQWMGTRHILLLVASVLAFLALPFFWAHHRRNTVLAGFAGTLAVSAAISVLSGGLENPCDRETSYYCLRIVDETVPSAAAGAGETSAKTLVIDHMIHSTNVLNDPAELWTPYIHAMDSIVDAYFGQDNTGLSWFFAGGGAYTHPRAIAHRFPDAEIAVSEIDPEVTRLAIEEMDLDTASMTLHHEDTRVALRRYSEQKFDVIVTDVFHDIGVPPHLVTHEFNQLAASRLDQDGLYLINIIDLFPSSRMVLSIYQTLKQQFTHVGVWIEKQEAEQARLTFVLSASNRPLASDILIASRGIPRTWYNIAEFIEQLSNNYAVPVLTDDYAPVERLISPLLLSGAGE